MVMVVSERDVCWRPGSRNEKMLRISLRFHSLISAGSARTVPAYEIFKTYCIILRPLEDHWYHGYCHAHDLLAELSTTTTTDVYNLRECAAIYYYEKKLRQLYNVVML